MLEQEQITFFAASPKESPMVRPGPPDAVRMWSHRYMWCYSTSVSREAGSNYYTIVCDTLRDVTTSGCGDELL